MLLILVFVDNADVDSSAEDAMLGETAPEGDQAAPTKSFEDNQN